MGLNIGAQIITNTLKVWYNGPQHPVLIIEAPKLTFSRSVLARVGFQNASFEPTR